MRLEDYNHFNAEEFIKSLKKLKKRREKLIAKLESLPELPAIHNTSAVKSTNIPDMTSQLAIKREPILAEIREIENCFSAYRYAKAQLTEDEREVIELFFEPKKPIWRGIEEYSQTHYMCRGNVYKVRRLTLNKIGEIIVRNFLQ